MGISNIFTRIKYGIEDYIDGLKEAAINRKYDRVIGGGKSGKREKKHTVRKVSAHSETSSQTYQRPSVDYNDTKKMEEDIRRRKEEEDYYRRREEEDNRRRDEERKEEDRRRREKD